MKATIIHNPAAGMRTYADELERVREFLAGQGWEIAAIEQTRGHGDATTYAREAVALGCDAVFVAGGDGTVAQTVDGLVGSETALAVLPGGTGNVFARQLNLPLPGGLLPHPLLESAHLILEGQTRKVDVGRVCPKTGSGPVRHFMCWSGVGFDAQLNRVVEEDPERKKRLGLGAFFVAGMYTLRDFAGTSAVVRIDGHRVSRRMIMLVANNIQLYGVIFKMATTAVLDDGWLNVYCFQGRGPSRTLLHAIRLLLSQHVQDPEVEICQARRIEISSARPLPVHVDGESIGYTPVVIEAMPRALKLMVPPCAPANLFVDGTGMGQLGPPWEWVVRIARDAGTAFREKGGLP